MPGNTGTLGGETSGTVLTVPLYKIGTVRTVPSVPFDPLAVPRTSSFFYEKLDNTK